MADKVIDRRIDILGGTPVFFGTRVPVRILIEYLEAGDRLDDFLDSFPTVSRSQAIEVLERAKAALAGGPVKLLLDESVPRGPERLTNTRTGRAGRDTRHKQPNPREEKGNGNHQQSNHPLSSGNNHYRESRRRGNRNGIPAPRPSKKR